MVQSDINNGVQKLKTKTKKVLSTFSVGVASFGLMLALAPGIAAAGPSSTVYDATPNPLPPNVASLGFEATSTSEFGDYVHLAGSSRNLDTVTVTMSDWAKYSDYASDARYSGNTSTWSHPITVNIYGNHLDANGTPDTLIATKTQSINIPWRPAGDPTCPDTGYGSGFAYKVDGQCYNGKAFNATFDLSSLNKTLPNDVIVGVAFNTADYGATPIHQPGPYNSLNVGIPDNQTASVGTDDNADNVYWNTTYPGYTAGFKQDTGWAPNGTVSLRITASANNMPTNKDQCKDNGWKTYGSTFKNQGDCVSFIATNGKNQPSGH